MESESKNNLSTTELKKSFNTINFWHSIITFIVILGLIIFFLLK